MKLATLFLLPLACSNAFAPEASLATMRQPPRGGESTMELKSELSDIADKITSTTEEYVGKADDIVLNRAMRVVDHAPAFFTLKALADAGGISASLSGITSNAGAFGGVTTALAVPDFMNQVMVVVVVAQALSLAKSALASDANEMSQADITATAAANFAAARMVGSSNPLLDTVLAAVVSGYAVRNGSSSGALTLRSASLQLLSSFTTVLSVLGVVSAVSAKIPFVGDVAGVSGLLGVAAYYVMVTREGNGTSRKAVHAGILAGMLVNAVKAGVTFSLTAGSVLTNVGLVGTAYLAYEGVNRLRKAVFA